METMTQDTPPDIFDYTDWRIYFTDLVEWMRMTDPHFSLRNFAKKCGQKSHTHFHKLLKGEGSISSDLADKIAHVLKMDLRQTNRLIEMVGGMSSVDHVSSDDYDKFVSTTLLCHMVCRSGDIVSPASISRDCCGIVTEAEAHSWINKGMEEGYVARSEDGCQYLGLADQAFLVAPETDKEKSQLHNALSRLSHNATMNRSVHSAVNANLMWATPEEIDVLKRSINRILREALEANESSTGRLYPYVIATATHRFPGHRDFKKD